MIINFGLRNFGPVREEQIFTFEADKSDHLEDYYVIQAGGFRLLKLGLLYGANASGKTTILKALDFLRDLVLKPEEKKTDELEYAPFLFDGESATKTTTLSIDFLQNGIRYDYRVEFNKKAIVREQLDYYDPKKATVFRRATDLEHQFTEITFGSKIKTDAGLRKALESNTLWNNTVLGGFLKTNVKLHQVSEAVAWFSEYLKPMVYTKTELESFVNSLIHKRDVSEEVITSILRKADFNITGLTLQEEEHDIPKGLLELMERQIEGDARGRVDELREKGKITTLNVDVEHTVGDATYTLPFDLESEGTKRYYGFAGLLALFIKEQHVIPIDELESSLHPDLYLQFILSFLVNSERSQLLATTHNREILGNRDVFRNDAIWFTDKSNEGATELYSLADFATSVVRDTSNILNAYKSGRLKAVPNLGDYYIDID